MRAANDKRLITRVCLMHYKYNMSQKEISQKLGISRPTISRLIKKGHDLGIVQVKVKTDFVTEYFELELFLEKALKIREAFVVREAEGIAAKCASVLREMIMEGDLVGVGAGSVLAEVARHQGEAHPSKAVFVPMVGTLGSLNPSYHSNAIAQSLAEAYGGESLMIHVPAVLPDSGVRDYMIEEPKTKAVMADYGRLNVAVFEVGSVEGNEMLLSQFNQEELRSLKEEAAVGEICLRFFNEAGEFDCYSENGLVVGIDLEQLKGVEGSVALASGPNMAQGVIGAAAGGYMKNLVTDFACAKEIERLKSG